MGDGDLGEEGGGKGWGERGAEGEREVGFPDYIVYHTLVMVEVEI